MNLKNIKESKNAHPASTGLDILLLF